MLVSPSPIWSLSLSNQHLKVAASPWRPFLMWKCPNHTEWSGWSDEWEKDCPSNEEKMFRNGTKMRALGCMIPCHVNAVASSRNLGLIFVTISYSGAFWELLTFVGQARNCSFSLVKSVDSLWGGNCYDDNNCTGMIGMANRKEVDFALGMKSSLQFKEC